MIHNVDKVVIEGNSVCAFYTETEGECRRLSVTVAVHNGRVQIHFSGLKDKRAMPSGLYANGLDVQTNVDT